VGPITALIPTPKPLHVAALGLTLRVAELTLRDLADLQAVLDQRWTDPYLDCREALATVEGDERTAALLDAYDRAEEGPPVYGEPAGRAYYATLEGFAVLAWVALRRYQSGLAPADVAGIVAEMTADEMFALRWHAEGGNSLRLLARLLMSDVPTPRPTPIPWGQAIHEVAEIMGLPYAAVYEMTLTEFRNARRGGKADDGDIPIAPGADLEGVMERWRRTFGRNGDHDHE
jgi:hypothetical protein